MPHLRSDIAPADDRRALADLQACLNGFDVVHTHSSKAGALGRTAAHRLGSAASCTPSMGSRSISSSPGRAGRPISRSSSGWAGTPTSSSPSARPSRPRPSPAGSHRRNGSAPSAVGVAKTPDAPGAHERAKARRVLGVPPGMRVVGTVGRLAFQKAPEHFVRALAGLGRSDVFGVWIGDGPLRAKTERLAGRCGLSGRMLFTGERADVEALLPGLDVFAMASRYEGLPCAIVEAMGAGLPVVATAVNSVPNVVIAGETGLLVPPGRPELLGRAIGYLIDHPAEAARLGAAGRAGSARNWRRMRSAQCSVRPTWVPAPALRPRDPNWPCHDGASGAVLPHRDHAGSTAGGGAGAGQRLGDDGRRVVRVRAGVRCVGAGPVYGRCQLVHRGHRDGPHRPRPSARGAGAHPDAHLLRSRPGDCPRAACGRSWSTWTRTTLTVSASRRGQGGRNGAAAMVSSTWRAIPSTARSSRRPRAAGPQRGRRRRARPGRPVGGRRWAASAGPGASASTPPRTSRSARAARSPPTTRPGRATGGGCGCTA